jgi:UDP-N-acetylmuramoyl-L-alanyl-D-glutamate--2,6-diaminopimelate ligase
LKRLFEIIENLGINEVTGDKNLNITGLTLDSRNIKNDFLFAAIRGTTADGHKFIDKAIEAGAKAILCEELPPLVNPQVTYVKVSDSAEAFGIIASNFYNNPSGKLKLVGITGTNGKTTTSTLLYDLFEGLGYKVGLISTIENRVSGKKITATHTTPDAESINLLIQQMVNEGCEYAFMEVSSHAVVQRRIAGLQFAGGVFTNITHEHLDYHKTFKAYIEAKKMFFDNLPPNAFALVNGDDKRAEVMLQNTRAKCCYYALRKPADFKARLIENNMTGLQILLDGFDFYSRLIGEFNVYNLTAAYAVGILLGQDKLEVLRVLSNLKAAEGRFDYVVHEGRKITGIVDYAHTPDALQKVLETIVDLNRGTGRVITVFGCGGDRDRTKRPEMARVACELSDTVIITSDNPRTENPAAIIEEIESGVPPLASRKVLTIENRKQAISTACKLAAANDVILIAGKGHEKYQEINGVRHPFDDKEILRIELG